MASFWGKSSKFLGSTPGEVSKFTLFPCKHPHKSRNVQIQAKKSTEQQKCKKMQSKLGNIHKTSGTSKIIHESARLCWQDIVSTPAKVRNTKDEASGRTFGRPFSGWKKVASLVPHLPIRKNYWRGWFPEKNMWDEIMSTCRFVKFRLWYIYDHLYRHEICDWSYILYISLQHCERYSFQKTRQPKKSTLNQKTNKRTVFAPPTSSKLANLFQNTSFMAFLKSDLSYDHTTLPEAAIWSTTLNEIIVMFSILVTAHCSETSTPVHLGSLKTNKKTQKINRFGKKTKTRFLPLTCSLKVTFPRTSSYSTESWTLDKGCDLSGNPRKNGEHVTSKDVGNRETSRIYICIHLLSWKITCNLKITPRKKRKGIF